MISPPCHQGQSTELMYSMIEVLKLSRKYPLPS